MNTEQLRNYEPFFGGFFVIEELSRNDDYTTFRVRKQSPDGRIENAVLRCYSFECDGALNGSAAYPARLRRLITDTETMLRLQNCANIVKFYEKAVVPTQEGYEFFVLTQEVTPLVKKEKIENLPKSEAYAIASSVCEALTSFRSLGITHRKICPENIFLSSTGDYLLGDFGLGGTYIAQEDYMSPEEHRVSADISSVDIYQTGMLLFKLLNHNRAPFLPDYPIEITQENRRNAFMRRMNGEMTGSFEGSEEEEEKIILKACAYAPSARYRNIASLKGDIDALIRALAPSAAHDYYAGYSQSPRVIQIENENPDDFDDGEESDIGDANLIIPEDYDFGDDTAESSRLIKALIISIVVIALIASGIIAHTIAGRHKKEQLKSTTTETTEPVTESTTETTTETTTEPTTESTTEPTTVPTTTPTTESTTVTTTESTTKFTLPEGFTWFTTTTTESTIPQTEFVDIDTSRVKVVAFNDSGRIDEIVVTLPNGFGKFVTANGDVLVCEYNAGSLIRTCYAETSCMYDIGDTSKTICDLHLPADFDMDTDNCSYRLVFDRGLIVGYGFSNNEFAVEFDASSVQE